MLRGIITFPDVPEGKVEFTVGIEASVDEAALIVDETAQAGCWVIGIKRVCRSVTNFIPRSFAIVTINELVVDILVGVQ